MELQVSNAFAPTAGTIDAADRVTVYGWKALAGSVIGYAMDGFDLLILGFMLTAISADLALTSTQAGSLVTWTLMGAVAGGLIFGTLSDHFGRIKVLTWTILLFAGFTGLCAFARGYWDLAAYRMIAGLGLGGEFGIGMALAAEAWPASKRARVSSYVALGWQAGVLLAAFGSFLLWSGVAGGGAVAAIVLMGLAQGAEFDLMAYTVSRYFGLRAFGEIYSYIYAAFTLGGVIGPLLMGAGFDATGSYRLVLGGFVVTALAAAGLMSRLGPYRVWEAAAEPVIAAGVTEA